MNSIQLIHLYELPHCFCCQLKLFFFLKFRAVCWLCPNVNSKNFYSEDRFLGKKYQLTINNCQFCFSSWVSLSTYQQESHHKQNERLSRIVPKYRAKPTFDYTHAHLAALVHFTERVMKDPNSSSVSQTPRSNSSLLTNQIAPSQSKIGEPLWARLNHRGKSMNINWPALCIFVEFYRVFCNTSSSITFQFYFNSKLILYSKTNFGGFQILPLRK